MDFKLNTLTVATALLILVLSCKKDKVITDDPIPQATVTILALADIDITSPGLEEVPAIAQVNIKSTSFNFDESFNFNNEGTINKTLNLDLQGSTYNFIPVEFSYAQTQDAEGTKAPKLFRASSQSFLLENNNHKDITIEYTCIEAKSSNVIINAYANLDKATADLEKVPAGISIAISGTYMDPASNENKTYQATESIDDDGQITTSLYVSDNGSEYSFTPSSFTYPLNDENGITYEASAQTVSLSADGTKTIEINYTAKENTGQINFAFNAEFNELLAGNEIIPSDVTLTIKALDNSWSENITITETKNLEGENFSLATIEVPLNKELIIEEFNHLKLLQSNENVEYTYYNNLGIFDAEDTLIDSDDTLKVRLDSKPAK